MAIGKSAGRLFGAVTGKVIRTGADALAGATGSKFIEEVGVAAQALSEKSGDIVGRAADGVGGTVRGLVSGDRDMTRAGIEEAGGAATETVVSMVQGVVGTVQEGANVVHGIRHGDHEGARQAARNLAKGMVVGSVSVGTIDGLSVETPEGEPKRRP
jgi:hypothetical protein